MQDNGASASALRKAVQQGRILGLVLCLAWPLVLMAMIGAGAVRPGTLPATGPLRNLAYVLMGLSFLAGGFVTWRTNRVMAGFRGASAQERPRIAFRETVLDAALFELSCLYGLVYWMLVGRNAFHQVLTLMALTPLMYFLFVPGLNDWARASEGGEG